MLNIEEIESIGLYTHPETGEWSVFVYFYDEDEDVLEYVFDSLQNSLLGLVKLTENLQ